jgi:hypothetical protein
VSNRSANNDHSSERITAAEVVPQPRRSQSLTPWTAVLTAVGDSALSISIGMTSEISTFGFIGDSDTELPDLALELADLGLLIPVEALGDRVAALSRRLAWDQEVPLLPAACGRGHRPQRTTNPAAPRLRLALGTRPPRRLPARRQTSTPNLRRSAAAPGARRGQHIAGQPDQTQAPWPDTHSRPHNSGQATVLAASLCEDELADLHSDHPATLDEDRRRFVAGALV